MHVGTPLFVQVSDSHIGFNKHANPDVAGTLTDSIPLVHALPKQPDFVMHTGRVAPIMRVPGAIDYISVERRGFVAPQRASSKVVIGYFPTRETSVFPDIDRPSASDKSAVH